MESEGNNHQYNEDEDTGRDNDTHKRNADDRAKDNSNEILSILEKKIGTRIRENMWTRK